MRRFTAVIGGACLFIGLLPWHKVPVYADQVGDAFMIAGGAFIMAMAIIED